MRYWNLLVDLGIDLTSVYLLVVRLYYRRHRRGDLLLAYITLNIGLFVTMSLLSSVRVDIATGFGLFAILSIIQLRSSTVQQEETAYYFAVLVLGLLNGMQLHDRIVTILMNIALIAVMYFVDNGRLITRSQRVDLVLDKIYTDGDELLAELERRLHGRVVHHIVEDIDYVREVMVIDVRYTPDPTPSSPAVPEVPVAEERLTEDRIAAAEAASSAARAAAEAELEATPVPAAKAEGRDAATGG